MANHKKKHPRTVRISFRVTPREKNNLLEQSMELNTDFSVYIRKLLGLVEDNDK